MSFQKFGVVPEPKQIIKQGDAQPILKIAKTDEEITDMQKQATKEKQQLTKFTTTQED